MGIPVEVNADAFEISAGGGGGGGAEETLSSGITSIKSTLTACLSAFDLLQFIRIIKNKGNNRVLIDSLL
ncbi:hypothetical protein CRH01_02690 [Chryseobacterium rhizosphaerae]|nr:hypothetical protein CRH01_02690 [Chryseobacterium rhizosphaerae]